MGNLALNIAASGLQAQQTAMDTVAQNLANANTPGYAVESPDLVTARSWDFLGVGDGVTTDGVARASDGLLEAGSQQAQGALAQSTALQQVLQGVQAGFPVSTSEGIGAGLSAFWQSWDAVAQNPSSPSDRAAVIARAQSVVTDLHQASAQIATAQADATGQLDTQVAHDNTLLAQVATLNDQIVVTEGTGAPANSLVDQQSQIVDQLAKDLGAVSTTQPDGTVSLVVGGVTVVSGNTAQTLQVAGSPGSLALSTGTGTPLPVSAGSASGLLAAVNQYLPTYQGQLDTVANDLASTVNAQLAAGYTATGAAGTALFQGSGAAGISVVAAVAADPSLLAASGTSAVPDATNDGANAAAMANLYDAAGGPDQAYRAFVQDMGSQVAGLDSQVQAQTSVANAAQANLQAVTGVNTDSQMVLMLDYQHAYQASAKVVSTVDAMIQSLLQAT